MRYRATIFSLTTLAIIACSGAAPQDVLSDTPVVITRPSDAGRPVDASDSGSPDACIQETNTEFCSRLGANCNVFNGADNCGNTRQVVNCGMCANASGCVDGRCAGCTSKTDAEICNSVDKNCGVIPVVVDNCGINRTPNCGTCPGVGVCTANKCVCTPETNVAFCARVVSNCGTKTATDNCGVGRTVPSCGTLTFNGIAGMNMGNVPVEMTGPALTKYIEAWINPSSATAGIVQVGSTPGAGTLSLSLIGGNLAIDGQTESGVAPAATVISIPLNTWTFVYAGVSGGTGYLGKIVNNIRTEQIMKTDIGSTLLVAGESVVIGSSFIGQMNQIRLWSKVPNTANYHDCIQGEPGLLRQWCMKEGSGATTADSVLGALSTLNAATWTTGICQ